MSILWEGTETMITDSQFMRDWADTPKSIKRQSKFQWDVPLVIFFLGLACVVVLVQLAHAAKSILSAVL
jgi:hypothetical protein